MTKESDNFDESTYKEFLDSPTKKMWERFGTKRRAGVLVPLFSVYSNDSIGIGELPDIKLMVDWCVKCGMSILQLLPMNDTGFDFTPYDAQSTFALDPMYLSIEKLKYAEIEKYEHDLEQLKNKFNRNGNRVNYGIKEAKLKLLWKIFEDRKEFMGDFESFCERSAYWLNDYVAYKVLKDSHGQANWEEWEEKYKYRESDAVEMFVLKNEETAAFYRWLQFELFEQFKEAKEYANSKGVFIQGDLPFLVSRDSADVWSKQNYFKLNISSGAPPDMYFAKGQRWGMPPYSWEHIKEHNYDYLIEKVKFSGNFYDMFRIDHFVGLFRLWTIDLSEPIDTYGLNGKFDPEDEDEWKEHGQKILKVMLDSSNMLPCAEDLGVVPQCSYETLEEYSLPGMEVQRWTRDWGETFDFIKTSKYRKNSVAVISSHDMTPLALWWEKEAGTVDKMLVEKICRENDFSFTEIQKKLFDMVKSDEKRLWFKKEFEEPEDIMDALEKTRTDAWMFYDMYREAGHERKMYHEFIGLKGKPEDKSSMEFIKAALSKLSEARSVFAINLLQDLLSIGDTFKDWNIDDIRVNIPGSISDKNWSIVMPVSLEEMLSLDINSIIKDINERGGRI